MSEDRGSSGLPGIPGSDEEPLAGIPGAEAYGRADTGTTAATPEATVTAPEEPAGASGPEHAPVPHRGRYIAELVVASLIAAFMALALLGFVIEASSSHIAHNNTSRGSQVGAAIFCVVILLLAMAWAWRAEHRLRHAVGHPVARALEARATNPPPTPVRRALYRQRHHYGPVALFCFTVLFGLFGFGMLVNAISKISDASRTSYVQHHGVLTTGTVENVNNNESCGRGGCTYTAEIAVTLATPVGGTTQSIVHYPDYSNLTIGDQVEVLVDPKQPGYSELPGHPDVQTIDWIMAFFMAAFFLLFFGVLSRTLWRLRRQSRADRAEPAALAAPA